MDKSDADKPGEDGQHLNRNRSFKSKQLVRSQAIRESHSPPRTISPACRSPVDDNVINNVAQNIASNNVAVNNSGTNNLLNNGSNNVVSNGINNVANNNANAAPLKHSLSVNNVPMKNNVTVRNLADRSVCDSDVVNGNGNGKDDERKQTVDIQLSGWEEGGRGRARRWVGRQSESSRELLSHGPRVACVCGACPNCPHCRGRRRRRACPIKQDSGIACSDDCPDCSDDTAGNDGIRKSDSLDVDDPTYYCRCPERKEKPKNLSLSRTDSEEKTEPTGPELVNFIKETLNKNARDRLTLLKIEKELHSLVMDTGRCIVRFPVMTSYGRMLVHRCAALFQLSHHLDQATKTAVMVSKSGTSGGRLPCTSFRQWCTAALPPSPQRPPPDHHHKSILKRDTHSLDEPGSGSLANSRSKSLEQREKDYERMKRRIFSSDNCSQDESQWPWLGGGPVKLLTPDTGRNKLLKVQSLEVGPCPNPVGRTRSVSKSHSFGGYAADDPTHSPQTPRLLSRQGDLASSSWRLSPSSSGYKTLSLRSTDSVTPSPTGGASPEPCASIPVPVPPYAAACGTPGGSVPPYAAACGTPGGSVPHAAPVVWCVSDMASVPPGALLIHPQTGRPLSNPDGSVYRFDPDNPPAVYDHQVFTPPDIKTEQADKKRGKLEKQHSFMDHECECTGDQARAKCCCDCRRRDACKQTDKSTPEPKQQKPTSPCKTRYEQTESIDKPNTCETVSQSTEPNNEPTNQRPAYNQPANEVPYDGYVYANERAYEHRQYEPTNQRVEQRRANQGHEIQYQFAQAVRPDEVTSPAQTQQVKQTPEAIIRPLSLTNVMYPTMASGYAYVNQCRMDQPLQPVYQATVAPPVDDQKQLATSPQQEPTFRIDPSYPYAAVDYAAQCGACVDPNAIRSYNVAYAPMEPSLQYQLGNVILPQPPVQYYPVNYPEVQWTPQLLPVGGKLLMPEPYQIYSKPMPQCGLIYPQVVPQAYPVCQPLYQAEPSRRNSLGRHASTTPRLDEHNSDKTSRRNSNEISAKIQQIKEQMSALNAGGRRNGQGLLGSHPAQRSNDETQLTTAARAIVNSIRSMQNKNNYQDNRREYHQGRAESRPRPERAREGNPHYRPQYLPRQMSPGTWCRRSPAPVHPVFNHPRRPHPDTRNGRRYT